MLNAISEKVSNAVAAAVRPLVAWVYEIITHIEPHDDELMARWLLRTFGEQLLPGIRKAKLRLVDSGLRVYRHCGELLTGIQLFAKGILPLGTLGGPCDEHDLPPKERAGASSATLAAELIKVAAYGSIKTMLAHTVRVDRTPTATSWDISAIVKAWHRVGVRIEKVCRLYDRIADASFNVLSGRVWNADWQTRKTFDQLAAEWLIATFADPGYVRPAEAVTAFDVADSLHLVGKGRMLQPLLGYLIAEQKNAITGTPAADHLFEVAGIVDALNQDNAPEEEIRDFVFTTLYAKMVEQKRYIDGCNELVKMRRAGTLFVSGSKFRIIRIISDNPEINRSARKLCKRTGLDAFIQFNTDGHLVVWYDKDRFTMDRVIAELRMHDMQAKGRYHARAWEGLTRYQAYQYLMSEGTIPEAPEWYYNPENGQIMSGSRTNRNKPVTAWDATRVVMAFSNSMQPTTVKSIN